MSTPGERLKSIRGNISQEEFAKLLGVSLRTYNGYENDEAQVQIRTFVHFFFFLP